MFNKLPDAQSKRAEESPRGTVIDQTVLTRLPASPGSPFSPF